MITAEWPQFSLPEIRLHKTLYAPMDRSLPYEKRNTIHRRDHKGFVNYFSSDGQPTRGFGGALFEGVFTDGTKFRYQGAWSSRASVVNKYWPERPVVDVVCDHRATHVTVKYLLELYEAQESADFGLCVVDQGYDAPIVAPWKFDVTGLRTIGRHDNGRTNVLFWLDGSNAHEHEKFLEAFK